MLNCFIVNPIFEVECNWSDREYELAAWGFAKWRRHQVNKWLYKGLRLGSTVSINLCSSLLLCAMTCGATQCF
jgi:hypothetical protein